MTSSATGTATRPAHQTPASTFDAAGFVSIASWKHLPWLRAGFSTRQGGLTTIYSHGAANEQNLGWTADDPATIVAENRRHFVGQFEGFSIDDLVTVRQVHGDKVCLVERGIALQTPEGKAVLSGDGLMTIQPGLLLGVQTADCVPVLIVDQRTRAVAAIHAGWRGTLARIAEHGVDAMRREFGSRPEDLLAAIGPAIGPCCFAVGADVRDGFHSQFDFAAQLFSEDSNADPATAPGVTNVAPQIYLDLWEANRRQLLAAGLSDGAITVVGECTACAVYEGRRKYFSHRAERGYTGRMLSVIGVTES